MRAWGRRWEPFASRRPAGFDEGVALLSVSVGGAPASLPKPVPAVMNMRLVAQAVVEKWQAWVPRYGAVAPVVISGVTLL